MNRDLERWIAIPRRCTRLIRKGIRFLVPFSSNQHEKQVKPNPHDELIAEARAFVAAHRDARGTAPVSRANEKAERLIDGLCLALEAARVDGERLDWLEKHVHHTHLDAAQETCYLIQHWDESSARAAIDQARGIKP